MKRKVIIILSALLAATTLSACAYELLGDLPQKVYIKEIPKEKESVIETAKDASKANAPEYADAQKETIVIEETHVEPPSDTPKKETQAVTETPTPTEPPPPEEKNIEQQIEEIIDAPMTEVPETLHAIAVENGHTYVEAKEKEESVKAANYRLDTGWYTKETLIAGLIEDGFTEEAAIYGAENCYINWETGENTKEKTEEASDQTSSDDPGPSD